MEDSCSKVSIVIVNWNSGPQLGACLDSIEAYGYGLVRETVVVDNASRDGSENVVHPSARTILIRAQENLGFGRACNLGAKQAHGEFILFLNPDAALHEETLPRVLSWMAAREQRSIGICGVQLVDESGHVARSCSRFPSVAAFAVEALGLNKLRLFRPYSRAMEEWNHMDTREVDQVIGAFFLMRRSLFEELGGFDERFFVYFEEVDLAYRAAKAGWRSAYLANASAFHTGGGTSSQVKAARLFYSLRSRLQYGRKHFSVIQACSLAAITLIVEPLSRSLFSFLRGGEQDLSNTVKGYGMLFRALPAILKARNK